MKIDERFTTQCATVFENDYDTKGTITRASIAHLTPAQLEAMFTSGGLFADLDAWFHTAIEMKACGTKTNALYDWIMSGADRVKFKGAISGQRIVGSGSLVFPFVMAKQDSVINVDFWAISTGGAQSGYTATVTGPLTSDDLAEGAGADRWIRVVSRYGVELDSKWFNPRTVIYIFTRKSGTGQAENGAWRVLASAEAEDGSYCDVLVTSENAGSSQAFAAAPTTGFVLIGVNNVNDYESYCHNPANYDGRKRVPFWTQTMRRTREIDEDYKEFLNRLNTDGVNRAWKEFGDIPIMERNRQDEENFQRAFVNAFFFQKPFNSNQTLALYPSLPTISTPSGFGVDPGTGGRLISYRANFIGVVEQLHRCDRVRDLYGQAMNFYEWLAENYRIMRARKTRKGSCTSLDWYCNSTYAARLQTAFLKYWKQESLDQFRLTWQADAQKDNSNSLGFTWNSYRVKWPQGLTINIVTNDALDDLFNANDEESQAEMGNFLLCLDIGKPGVDGRGGSIYYAQMAANKTRHVRGDLDALAKIDADWSCVMRARTTEVNMTSETGTVVVECPQDNLWMWNIGDEDPVMTGPTADEENLY